MKMTFTLALVALTLAGGTKAAQAGYANAYSVTPLPAGGFQITANISPGASSFWCGAATYAQSRLSQAATQRIYVTAARRTHGDGSVVGFALTPPESGAVQSVSHSVDLVGNNLSVTQARQYCYDKTITD